MANRLEGSVCEIGPTGNLVCDIANEKLSRVPTDENTIVNFGGHETHGLFASDHGQPDSTMVAYLGKSGFLEIEIVGVSLSEMLGIGVGECVYVQWSK